MSLSLTQPLNNQVWIQTSTRERHSLFVSFFLMIITFGELGFYLDQPTHSLLTDQETLILVILPNSKKYQSQHQEAKSGKSPFLSDRMLTTNKTWKFQSVCLCFRRKVHCCHHFWKDFLASDENGVSLLLLMFFPFVFAC